MLDIYDYEDFAVIFDYVCDIEVHTKEGFEFYQLKTHKGGKVYSIHNILKMENGKSILGKLYVLKSFDKTKSVKLALVSNSYLKDDKKVITDLEQIDLSSISKVSLDKITKALKMELNLDNIDISNMYYIFTSMNLNSPDNDIIGKIVSSFVKIKGCEPKKPNALYRLIYDTVSGKACCELRMTDYKQLIENKGITKGEFDKLLNCHIEKADNSVKNTKEYIENMIDFKEKRKMNLALAKLMRDLYISKELERMERIIASYILVSIESLPSDFEKCVDILLANFGSDFSPEYSKVEIYVFIVLILKRFEEGVYDE